MRASASPTSRTRRWTAASFVALCIGTAWLYATRGWYRLGVPPIGPQRPPFSDAHAQLVTADACIAGAGSWIERVCFLPSIDVLPHAQSYEPWLLFSRVGLGHEHYVAIGWTMVVAFYLAVCLLFQPGTWRQAGVLLLLVLSPAVQLAVERANFDLLMATILVASGSLLSRRSLIANVAGCTLLGAGTTLKIYSGLSTLFAGLAAHGANRRIVAIVSVCTCVLAVAALGPANIVVLGDGAPQGATRFSTGAHLTFNRYGAIGGSLVVATALAVCAWLSRSILARGRRANPVVALEPWAAVFTVSWLSAVPLFLLKDSYDYRFVLWLPMLALALRLSSHGRDTLGALGRTMVVSFFFAAYVELACKVAASASLPAWVEAVLVLGKHFGMWCLVFASGIVLVALVRSKAGLAEPLRTHIGH